MSGERSRGRWSTARALVLAHALVGCSAPPEDVRAEAPERARLPPPVKIDGEADAPSAYVGVVIAPRVVELAAEVPGVLVEQGAALGERVDAGALLARVQPPMLAVEIEVAEAALAQVDAARAEQGLLVDAAARTLAQEQQLASIGIASSDDRAQAQLELDRARASARRLAAQQAERRAELHRLHAEHGMGSIVAPFSGTVSTWYRPTGTVVGRGDRLVRLVAEDRLWVRFAVPLGHLAQVEPGRTVDVVPVPEGPRRSATVRRVAPELDLASQLMLVEAELHETVGLKAGQACHVMRALPGAAGDGARTIGVSSTDPAAHPGGT